MNTEDLIDWKAIPGCEWYRPEDVPKAIAGIRNCAPVAPDILSQVANNHSGELYPAAVAATSILLEIALHSSNRKAAMQALAAIDELVWFRGSPPFDTIVHEGVEIHLDEAIRAQVEAARPQLVALADREKRLRRIVLGLLESVDGQAAS